MINETPIELKEHACRGEAQHQWAKEGEMSESTDSHLLGIVSTFTADLIRHPVECWMQMLDIPAVVSIAPYAQVMQTLLDRTSLLAKNQRGFNIVLMRLEDWIRDRAAQSLEENQRHVHRAAKDFVTAIEVLRTRTGIPLIVFFCPCSSSMPEEVRSPVEGAQRDLIERLGAISNVHCLTHSELVQLYPMADYEDVQAERIGHIPYVQEYFVAMATLLARRIAALCKPRHKVIAVDCDNTLWKGICGEDGGNGVELTAAHLEFQRMLVAQNDAGMLLCLCSKNNVGDVEAVFRSNPDMPLRQDHLICSRVNWESKSSNLESIAEELGLSLDSFIFVDDSPVECAEVKARCPSVLTLQMPEDGDEIRHLTNHAWAFDHAGVTAEAKERTVQYRQNQARARALREMSSLDDFLSSLELKVETTMMRSDELARVVELIHRTNQFNLTGVRRSSGEIESLWISGDIQIAVTRVRDRFGDYGLVGVVIFCSRPPSLEVDNFVLSCRVLGRGVEQRILGELGRIARLSNLTNVHMRYRPTPRNAPAWEFLQKSCRQFQSAAPQVSEAVNDVTFTVPVEEAERLRFGPAVDVRGGVLSDRVAVADSPQASHIDHRWHDVAYRFSRLRDIVGEIKKSVPVARRERDESSAPITPMETALSKIWTEILGMEAVSTQADFFELGGDSVLAVQVIARMESILGVDISVYQFFEAPTIAAIARKLESANESDTARMDSLLRNMRQEVDQMSDAAVWAGIAELERELGGTEVG